MKLKRIWACVRVCALGISIGLVGQAIGTAAEQPPAPQDDLKTMALTYEMKPPGGQGYEALAPDTLDLTERAALGLHGMAGMLDPEADYEFWWKVEFGSNPVYMFRDDRSFPACGPKFLESVPMMTVMTGSNPYQKEFEGLKNLLVSWIDGEGLMYTPVGPKRPWDTVGPEDYVQVYGQSRMMLALMAIYQLDKDPRWLKLIGKMADGLCRIAVDKGDYAYYPINRGNAQIQMGEGFCYPRSGWYETREAAREDEGRERSVFMYHCGPIRALTRWYRMSGDEKALRTAGKLVNYVMSERFWGSEYGWPKIFLPNAEQHFVYAFKVVGSEHGHFIGHFHGHIAMLYALVEYADAANNKRLKDFVRYSYEYARGQGIARLGLFGETCTISDMVATAIKLSESGVGDYWDDVDGYIRNQLIEQQLTNAEHLRKLSGMAPRSEDLPRYATNDNVIERTLGVFGGTDLGQNAGGYSIQCCTGNGTQGLYYAWEGIIRETAKDQVQVNLLLNRASPWMDVDSYLPYEGKVVLKNKTARLLSIRIPTWADRRKAVCSINGKKRGFTWIGNYAVVQGLRAKDEIVFTFPMLEETVSYTVLTRQQWTDDPRPDRNPLASSIKYTCHFKGNTLVDLSPRLTDPRYPNYERDHYKQDKAPMKKTNRFETTSIVKW